MIVPLDHLHLRKYQLTQDSYAYTRACIRLVSIVKTS